MKICWWSSNFSDINLDTSNISRLFFIGEYNFLVISSGNLFQISIFFNNLTGDPFAELIKSSNFNFAVILNSEGPKQSFKKEFIFLLEIDRMNI